MKKYEKEVMQAHLDNEKEVLKKLETIYEDAIFEIDERLAVLLGRDDATLQHVIYQADYQRALKTQIKSILEKLQANEFETVAEYLEYSYDEGFLGVMYSLQKQGIPLVIPISQEQVIAAIQHETKLKSSLYTEMGKDISRLQKQIAGEISRGISSASSYTEIAQNIARYSKIPMNRAMTISRTESHRISETASNHAQERAKSKGAKIKKIWDASLDAKTRESHMRVDGEIRELNEKFSNGLMYPGEAGGEPEEVINCRCRSRTEAEWALDVEETKSLGDVSEMTDKRKEEIAKKLGVSVHDLEGYSGQIVTLKSKNYQDFKKQYNKIAQKTK